ncbi:MAG TPA: Hpt domain-containing protein, partial [Burkholderiales bacterium]|nr:Hpt domain-containing protein [Burkholderiales bacterium]
VEAAEHVEEMSSGINKLRDSPGQETIERIYREAHSLKGAARAVDMREIESMCQSLEDMLAGLKKGVFEVSMRLLDEMQEIVDCVSSLLPAETKKSRSDATLDQETVRVDLGKLKSVMRRSEELLSQRLAQQQRLNDLDEIIGMLAAGKKRCAEMLRMLPASGRGNRELDAQMQAMKGLESRMGALRKASARELRLFSTLADELLQDVREMFMMPFSFISDAFP